MLLLSDKFAVRPGIVLGRSNPSLISNPHLLLHAAEVTRKHDYECTQNRGYTAASWYGARLQWR